MIKNITSISYKKMLMKEFMNILVLLKEEVKIQISL